MPILRAVTVCGLGLVLAGCVDRGVNLSPREQDELLGRARSLLIRGAQSDLDIVRANAIEALTKVMPQQAVLHARAALEAEQPLARYAGLIALGEQGDPTDLADVRRLLSDPDPRVRLAAAFAAYRCGDRGQAALLVDTLNDHPDENMRSDAAYLIGRLKEPEALKRLKIALRRERSPRARTHILTAMALLGDRGATDSLIEAVLGSEPATRLVALQSLAEIAEPRAEDALLFRLNQKDDYVQTRLLAARALGRIGSRAGYDLARDAIDDTGENTTETMQIRSLAAHALGAIGDARALLLLKRLAEAENDPRTQVAACYAICRILAGRTPTP